MRNLKKLLAVIVSVCVLATFAFPAFAAEKTAAEICEDLGVLKGDSSLGVTDTYLAKGTTRDQAAILYLRLIGKEDEAYAFEGEDNFADADQTWDNAKKALAYLKANPDLGWQGVSADKFDPKAPISAQQMYKVCLEALGYKQGVDFEWADVFTFAADKGLSLIADVTEMTNNDVAIALVEALKLPLKDSDTTLAADLVAKGVITEAAAEAAGLISGAVALDVSGAVALNSKVIEVSLNTAATAKDVAAATFTVKDAAGKEIAVAGAEFAPWSTDGKSVLVTLAADTTAGALYTLTADAKSVNFGGKAVDTGKPAIVANGVVSTEYNQVKVTFDEPVLISGATFVIAEKYGTKAALEVTGVQYKSSTEILLATAEQKDATLYGIEVAGAVDLAGNTMDKDSDQTFTGTKKNDSDLKVAAAYGLNNPEEVTVQFNVRVDAATIAPENFKVEEMYGTKEVLTVTEAKLSVKDDTTGVNGATIVDDVNSVNDAQKNVVLTVPGLKDSTLYKVTVSGMSSAYGKALSTTSSDQSATFSGKKRPSDPFTYSIVGGAATSNTKIEVLFEQKVVKADAENIANYAIVEAYGNKAALSVTKAELKTGGKKVELTVAPMQTVLYKMTITNVNDIYGNAIKTADSANVVSFSGVGVANKISAIDSIMYDGTSKTVLIVNFNQAVGSSANDVSHYTIDKNVGYPEKAVKGDNADEVKLTIPKLTPGETYKLTVKGLENADGVAMDSDGVSATFVGRGDASTLPELVAVMPVDNQTLKVFFDRDVTNSSIAGATKIWDKDNKALVDGALSYVHNANVTSDLENATEYAYQDPENANALIIRIDTDDAFKAANKDTTLNAFKLVGASAKFATDKNSLIFAPKEDEPLKIKVDGVMALNKNTIRVYFNQPVYGTLATFAKVDLTKTTYTLASITLSNPTAIDSTKKVYDFKTSASLTNASYWLIVNDTLTAGNQVIEDVNKAATNGYVTLDDEDTSTGGVQQFRQFAGSGADVSDLKNIQVIMEDEKTIKVYFPDIMNKGHVETAANYNLVGSDGTTEVIMEGDVDFAAATHIGEIVYSTDDNTAIITLNKKIKSAPTGLYLWLDDDIENATGTAFVKDGDDNIVKQFALSSKESAKVAISEVSFENGAAGAEKLTITFNQQFKTNVDITTGAALIANLGITIPGKTIDAAEIASVVALDKNDGIVANTQTTFTKKLVITFVTDNATADAVGKVKIASASGFTGINGNAANTDSELPFAQ